jgi:hypothetical protein
VTFNTCISREQKRQDKKTTKINKTTVAFFQTPATQVKFLMISANFQALKSF